MQEQASLLLIALTQELKSLGLWQNKSPSDSDLASTAPFCCDTLAFEQWLQFIFIERITIMIKENMPLPSKIHLLPMAEEAFKHMGSKATLLLDLINEIDLLFQSKSHG